MSHPTTRCPEAFRLYKQVINVSTLHNNTPEELRMPAIMDERREKQWQVAWSAYQSHVHTCQVCQSAIQEDEGIP